MTTEVTAKSITGLQQAIRDDQDDNVLKHANSYLAVQQDEEVLLCKVVALARTGKYQQAQQLIGGIKKSDEFLKFLKGYLAYRLGNYQEAIDLADSSINDPRMEILKSQVFCKRENYEMSCNILASMIAAKSADTKGIYEDLCSNFFNSLALHVWTLVSVGFLLLGQKTSCFEQPDEDCSSNIHQFLPRLSRPDLA
jgi:tetratricopeptide (TPR) repeat protein